MARSQPCSCSCYRGRALFRWGRFLPTQTVQWHSALSIAVCASRSFLQGSTQRPAAVASPSLWCEHRTRHPCPCPCDQMLMTVIRQTSLRVRILQPPHHLAILDFWRTVCPMTLGTSNNILIMLTVSRRRHTGNACWRMRCTRGPSRSRRSSYGPAWPATSKSSPTETIVYKRVPAALGRRGA